MQNEKKNILWLYPNLISQQNNRKNLHNNLYHASCYPCTLNQPPPALYTFYAITSLTVVILVCTLIWVPLVDFIAQFNYVTSNLLVFMNKEMFGNNNWSGLNQLGEFINSQLGLLIISVTLIVFFFYLASENILIFTGCYINNLPNHKCIQILKVWALGLIENLLEYVGRTKTFNCNNNGNIEKVNLK